MTKKLCKSLKQECIPFAIIDKHNNMFGSLVYNDNYLGKIGISIFGNTYFGRFYGSYHLKTKFDFPSKLPFYIETSFTRKAPDIASAFRTSTTISSRESSKPEKIPTRIAPRSRKCLVIARVSTP